MKGVKIIVGMIMDVTKAIEEEVVSIHQKGKKKPKLIFFKRSWKMTQLEAK